MGNAFCTFRIHNDGSDEEINNRQDTRHDQHRGKNNLADDNFGDFHNQRYFSKSTTARARRRMEQLTHVLFAKASVPGPFERILSCFEVRTTLLISLRCAFSNVAVCMEPMDGEDGLESNVTLSGTLIMDEESPYMTFSEPPNGQSPSDAPSVLRKFNRPVIVKGLQVVALSSPTSESTTAKQPTPREESVTISMKVLTKKPDESQFSTITDESSQRPRVSQPRPSRRTLHMVARVIWGSSPLASCITVPKRILHSFTACVLSTCPVTCSFLS